MGFGRGVASSATLVAVFASAACSSHHAGGSAVSSPARSSVADSPEHAALGFYDSLRAAKAAPSQKWAFSCPEAQDMAVNISWNAGAASRTAHTTQVGDRWRVTVSVGASHGTTSSTFEVRREGTGYCVSREVGS